jgi:hypothetical protein
MESTSLPPAYVTEQQLIYAAAEGYGQGCGRDLPPTWEDAQREFEAGQSLGDSLAQWVVTEICSSAQVDDGEGEFDVARAIRALQLAIQDLQNVVDALSTLHAAVAQPPHRSLTWRPVACGGSQWRIYVEGVLSKGFIGRYYDRYQVNQVSFDRVVVDTLEDGYDLLLKREWSDRQAARLKEALATRRTLLEKASEVTPPT